MAQREKFDKDWLYTKKWVRDLDLPTYPVPMVEHRLARQSTVDTYKKALGQKKEPLKKRLFSQY